MGGGELSSHHRGGKRDHTDRHSRKKGSGGALRRGGEQEHNMRNLKPKLSK